MRFMRRQFWLWLVLLLVVCGQATIFVVKADETTTTPDPNACVQLDWRNRLATLYAADANLPDLTAFPGPVLGPVYNDPNMWEVTCGPWRRAGRWCDPEGYAARIEVVSSTLPCEATITDQFWTLTVDAVPVGWQMVCVRITDIPPDTMSQEPASRDVYFLFKGIPGLNTSPVLR